MIPVLSKYIVQEVLDILGWQEPKPEPSRMMVITGHNAAGKSFVRRLFSLPCKQLGIETIPLSVELRSSSGNIGRSFIYNDESIFATGLITANTIITAFNTSRGREKAHLIIWDEPEIGMSEELQHAALDHIKAQIETWPEHLEGLVFCTHSRIFAERLVKEMGASFVNLGGQHVDVDSWLARDVRIPMDFENLWGEGVEKWRQISDLLANNKKENAKNKKR